MSLLSICQNVASDLGLRQPVAIVGATDLTAQILFRLANKEGKELSRWHDWQALINEVTFTSLATEEQTDALDPDVYDRMIYNPEVWNRSTNQRYAGPTQQRYWQRIKAQTTVGAIGMWRILGKQLHIYPVPTAGQTIAFEIISKNWCESSGGTAQSAFMVDTDTALLDESVMELGMIWRYRAGRGFPQYAEDMVTYEGAKERAASSDRGTGRIRPESTAGQPLSNPLWSGVITS